jgi:hypothetical protein
MKEDAAAKGLPSPDEEKAREDCLRKGIAAPDLASIKDFLWFYVATSKPQIDMTKPTRDSIQTVAEWFFAGFTRVIGTATDDEDRSEMFNVMFPSL